MSWTVYCHTHIESGRRYIGLTKQTMESRWKKHVYAAKRFAKGGRWHFPNAIKKYGPDAFSHEVLEVCETLEKANQREAYWIEFYDARNPEFGFNLAEGGQHKPHPIRKNPWDDPEYRTKQLARGFDHLHTPEAFAKMKATVNTPEFKALQSAISQEIHSRPGVRAKISAAAKGRVKSPETLAKMSANAKGRVTSQETRAKIGAKSLGRRHSQESKNKMSTVFSALPAAQATRERLQKFMINNGAITKVCNAHGPVTDVYVKKSRKGDITVRCAECERAKLRERYKRKHARGDAAQIARRATYQRVEVQES